MATDPIDHQFLDQLNQIVANSGIDPARARTILKDALGTVAGYARLQKAAIVGSGIDDDISVLKVKFFSQVNRSFMAMVDAL